VDDVTTLRAEVAELKARLATGDALIEQLLARLAGLDAQLAERDAQLAELLALAGDDPRLKTRAADRAKKAAAKAEQAARDAAAEELAGLHAQQAEASGATGGAKPDAETQRLQERIAELEARLRQDSTNSSRPPSSDPPWKKRRPGGTGKRKKGGQPKHKGTARALTPPHLLAGIVPCRPPSICGCGGHVDVDDACFERRQVIELPEPAPCATEYRLLRGRCCFCGKKHRGSMPEGVSQGILGPRLLARISLLTGSFKMSKREACRLLKQLFGVEISLGRLSSAEGVMAAALEAPHAEVAKLIKEQAVVHADETGHKHSGQTAWVWVFTTMTMALFVASALRAAKVAKTALGEGFKGILISDRWTAYVWVDAVRRQLCWAHLARDFEKMKDRRGRAEPIGDRLLALMRELFALWHHYREGIITRALLIRLTAPLRVEVGACLRAGLDVPSIAGMCRNIIKLEVALWTFLNIEGVEPTNNQAEQDIRKYVLWRLRSFGTDSDRGDRFVERMLTAEATCRKQGRDFLAYLDSTVSALLKGHAAPSLIKTAA